VISTGHVMSVSPAFMDGVRHVADLRRKVGADIGAVLRSKKHLTGEERQALLEELTCLRAQRARLDRRVLEISERLEPS
jgi:hypothetical protein